MTWISVKERLPEERQIVLVALDSGFVSLGSRLSGAGWGVTNQKTSFEIEVTHWQPLPEPPASPSESASPSALADRGNSLPPQESQAAVKTLKEAGLLLVPKIDEGQWVWIASHFECPYCPFESDNGEYGHRCGLALNYRAYRTAPTDLSNWRMYLEEDKYQYAEC